MQPAERRAQNVYLSLLSLLPVVAGTALLCAAFPASAKKPDVLLSGPHPIAVMARPVFFSRDKPEQTAFGKLIWLGSLELTSPAKTFGGYSALAIDKSGTKLVAISDAGTWLRADIVLRDGRMQKITNAVIGPLLGKNGKPLCGKCHDNDAEAISFAAAGSVSGDAYIGFEQRHRIGVYSFGGISPGRLKRHLKLPAKVKGAKRNSGLEAVTILRGGPQAGGILALTEEYYDKAGNHLGWLIGGPAPGQITLKRRDGFAVTDAVSLPNGDVIILERRFRFSEGMKMRLRRVRASDIRPGALLDGDVLLFADALHEIDNMEGLAVHSDARGRNILTLISDDNFNRIFQSTMLIQFALP